MRRKLGIILLIFALVLSNLAIATSEEGAEASAALAEQAIETDASDEVAMDDGEASMDAETDGSALSEDAILTDVSSDDAADDVENTDQAEEVEEIRPEPVDDVVEEIETEISDDFSIGDTDDSEAPDESAEDDYEYLETASAFASGRVALQASSSLQRPQDVDNGSYVNAYRKYMEDVSKYKGFAVLADFDLDGAPELLALSDQWNYSGAACCYVKYTGNNFIVHEDTYLYDLEGSLYLTQENGSYVWYKSHSYANTGIYDSSIRKLTFNSNMKPTEEIRFGLSGNTNEGRESYQIGSTTVTKSQYDQESAKWDSVTKLCELDPKNFKYPADWDKAASQYSVVGGSTGQSSRIPTITVTRNAKYRVNVGTNFQILLNGYTAKSYKSSSKKIATVDYTGLVRPLAKGTTKITIKLTNGKRYTISLNVLDPTIPTSISLNMSGTNNVKQGDTVTLTAVLPQGTYSGIKWKSNHKSVATVNNGVVTFKKKGSVTITATTIRGNKKAKVKFKVAKYDAKKDLRNYGWRTVQGTTGDRKLVFRKTHTGGYMSNHKFAEGEQIFVNLTWREGGDAIAYDNGTYGYVQAKYIAW